MVVEVKWFWTFILALLIAIPLALPSRGETSPGWTWASIIGQNGDEYPSKETIAFSSTGVGVAAWLQEDSMSNIDLWANLFFIGEGWGVPIRLTFPDGNRAYDPFATFDGSGNPVLFYSQHDGTYMNIQCNFLTDDGWSKPELLESRTGNAFYPRAVFDAEGKGYAVWYQNDGLINSIMMNEYTPGSGWGTARLLESDNTGHAMDPRIDMDASGNVIIAWHQTVGSNSNVYAARFENGVGWHDVELLETLTGNADEVEIAMNPSGSAVVAWVQDESTDRVASRFYHPKTGWETSILILADNEYISDLCVDMDDDGYCAASWYQMEGMTDNAFGCLYDPITKWGTPKSLEDGINNAYNNRVRMDGSGNTVFTWVQKYDLWSIHHSRGSGWSEPAVVERRTENVYEYSLEVDPEGTFWACWGQHDGYAHRVWESRLIFPELPVLRITSPAHDQVTNSSRIAVGGETDPSNTVSVNGVLVSVDGNGMFLCTIGLAPGTNEIVVTARNPSGTEVRVTRNVVYVDEMAGLIKDIALNISSVMMTLESMTGDLDAIRERLDGIDGDVISIRENITRLEDQVAGQRDNITHLLERAMSLEQVLQNGENGDLTILNESIEVLGNDLAGISDRLLSMENEISDLDDDVDDLGSLGDDIDSIQMDLKEVTSANNVLTIIVIVLSVLVLILIFLVGMLFFKIKGGQPYDPE